MTPPIPDVATSLAWTDDGTEFVLDRLETFDPAAPSRLPGWTNGHVAAHIARNADGVRRLLHWAATGVETPMYPSPEARAAEIERDATRPAVVHLADVSSTAEALAEAARGMAPEAWTAELRIARGPITAVEVPWMRVKELWLHGVDLGAPASAIPPDVAAAVLTDVAGWFDRLATPPSLLLVETDSGLKTVVGGGADVVTGPAAELACWLAGRTDGAALHHDGPLPTVPAWL